MMTEYSYYSYFAAFRFINVQTIQNCISDQLFCQVNLLYI
ncbi:hypothetical protein [Bacillus phage vB_BceM_Bc431v3]|uniref:Uncharacterized protein n=1 Tax=Bacillus phage vB_BceM_Bc431v3 TaxID=1195072 RepID=M4HP71_9CAUD|nr:hypothetical protein K201_gp054 [Bacillus phage vB_BceM_Bc431v3]AFQ96362.1 hypothetical protein [Bacillus phage vB_BceM_Bc431v3]